MKKTIALVAVLALFAVAPVRAEEAAKTEPAATPAVTTAETPAVTTAETPAVTTAETPAVTTAETKAPLTEAEKEAKKAQRAEKFAEAKAKRLEMIKKHQACVEAATDFKALKACKGKHHKWHGDKNKMQDKAAKEEAAQ